MGNHVCGNAPEATGMTQASFNNLYYSTCYNIRQAEQMLKFIETEKRTADRQRIKRLEGMEHNILITDIPILKRIAYNLRRNNYQLFLHYSVKE